MKYLFTLVFLIWGTIIFSQCGLTKNYVIEDLDNEHADTTNVSILVEGAVNNNLATQQQGVCGVKLKFKHPFMKELFIELVSPSGQKVTLVGGDIVATNTGLITWDVTFVPCLSAPAPDPGFSDRWENDQLWQNLTTYTGQYHPHIGCLEDFNTGSVNGTWTIRCIDFEDGGKGNLLDAKMIFCQDQGVSCGECVLNPGIINNPDIFTCEGDESLDISIDKTYPNNIVNNILYNYNNIVFKDSTILSYTQNPDLRTFPAGRYTICGLQVSKLQASVLPAVGSRYDQNTLSNYFFGLGACASLSDSCMTVEILKTIDPIQINGFICKGQEYIIDGKAFDTQGNYTVTIEKGACDSIVNLNLTVIDIRATIRADRDSISCNGNTIGLEGSNTGTPVNSLSYFWFTSNGSLQGDASLFIIDAVKEGQYFLELTGITPQITCKDTVMKEVFPDRTFPEITFENQVITCTNDTVFIKAFISLPTQVIQWSPKDLHPFEVVNDGIRVWHPGIYYISVLAENGCSTLDSVEVIEDTFFETPVFSHDTLDCRVDSILINVSVSSLRNLNFSWDNIPEPYKTSNAPKVATGGIYQLTVTDADNGCHGTFQTEVIENRQAPLISSLSVDTLTCLNRNTTPNISIDLPIESYEWTGPGFLSTLANPSFSKEGIYNLKVVAALNGCIKDTTFEVVKDTILPELVLTADSLSCNRDSIQIFLSSNLLLISVSWSGPEGFTSNVASPYVKIDGIYVVRATYRNGCEQTTQILVSYGLDLPDALLPGDSLKCGLDTINIRLFPIRQNYSYEWSGPGLLENNVMSPKVNASGLYAVTITDNLTGCTSKKVVSVVDDRIYTTPQISVAPLDCAQDSVQIILSNTDIKSIVYEGDGFYSEAFSPFVSKVGIYTYTLINNKNCVTEGNIEVISNDEIPILDKVFSPIMCNQDSFIMVAKSSISPTTFRWSGPNQFQGSGDTIVAFVGGEYAISGTAPNGCKAEIRFNVGYDTLGPVFNVLPYGELTCKDTLLTLATDFPSTSGQIVWNDNIVNPILEVSTPGEYFVTATALNQCSTVKKVNVNENKTFPTYQAEASVINCRDMLSNISIAPTSSYIRFSWRNDINPSMIANSALTHRTSFAGSYSFELENEEGCITTGTVEVIADLEKPRVTEVIQDTINCGKNNIDIGVQIEGEALEYLWNGPELNDFVGERLISISEGGAYFLKITGINYCVTSQVFQIEVDSNIPLYTLFSDTLTCDKGKINIGVTPISSDLNYNWSGPMQFESNIRNPRIFDPGLYVVTITGSNDCFLIDSIMVLQNITKPLINIADTLYLPCDSSAITLKVSSDVQIIRHNWLFPDGTLVNTAEPTTNMEGQYSIQVAGSNGCGSINKLFFIDIDNTPPDFNFTTDTINCNNTVANLKAESSGSDVTYIWRSPTGMIYSSPSVSTSEAGVFTLFVSDINKCKDTILVTVSLDTIRPKIEIIKSGDIQCEIRMVNLDANGSDMGNDIQALWTTSDGSITDRPDNYFIEVNRAGTYTFELTNTFNGCKNQRSILITESTQQFTNVEAMVQAPICEGVSNGSFQLSGLNGIPPYRVEVNGTDRGQLLTFSNLISGIYNIVVTDDAGCKQVRNIEIPKSTDLTLDIAKIMNVKFGDSILLKPLFTVDPTGMAILKWYKKDSLICEGCPELWVRPFINTIYRLEYSVNGFCKETMEVLIKVSNDIESAIPNVFRPMSGNGNDFFFIPQTRGIKMVNSIYIFDRWAENVFKAIQVPSGEPLLGWDGTFNGKDCQPGVYIVIAELTLSDGNIWKYRGDVLLTR